MNQTKQFSEEVEEVIGRKLDENDLEGFITNDFGLILVLSVLNGHEIIGTMETEDWDSRYFLFAKSNKLDADVDYWNKVSEESGSGPDNVCNYLFNQLKQPDANQLIEMQNELVKCKKSKN